MPESEAPSWTRPSSAPAASPRSSAIGRTERSISRLVTLLERAVLVVLLVGGLILAGLLWHERGVEVEREERGLDGLLEANAIAVERRIGALDLALVGLTAAIDPDRFGDQGYRLQAAADLAQAHQVSQRLATFLAIDRDGQVRIASGMPPTGQAALDLSNRASFRAFAADPTPRLIISDPREVRFGLIEGKAVLDLSRPILDEAGRFAGELVASIDLVAREALLPAFHAPHGIRVTLFTEDGVLIDQVPPDPGLIGRSFATAPLFAEQVPHADRGGLRVERALNGDPGARHLVWRRIPGRGLVLIASKPREAILSSWQRHAQITGACWLVLSGMALVLTSRLGSALRRRGSLATELSRRDAIIGGITDGADAVLWNYRSVAPEDGFLSPSAASLLGRPVTAALPSLAEWRAAIHPEDRPRVLRSLAEAPVGSLWHAEYRILGHLGTTLWIRDRARILAEPDGASRALGVALDITAEVDARAALRHREAELAAAARIARLGSFRRRVGSLDTIWSDDLRKLLGIERRSMRVEEWLAMVHPDDRDRVAAALRTFGHSRREGRYRTRLLLPDRRVLHVAVLIEPETDDQGRTVAYFGIVQDITDLVALQDDLARRSHQLETAARLTGLGTFRRSLADGTIEWSEASYQLFGQDPATFRPSVSSVLPLIHPEDRGRIAAEVERHHVIQGIFSYTCRLILPDGGVRHAMMSCETEFDSAGRPVAMFGVGQDVTPLVAMRADLERRQAELAAAMRMVALATYRRDYTKDTLEWSPEGYAMYGLDPATFRPSMETVMPMVLPEDRTAAQAALDGLRTDGKPRVYRMRIRRTDGQVRHLQVTAELELGRAGPVGHFGLVQDITDLVAIRTDLERRSAELDAARQLAGLGIFRRDIEGRIHWSPEIYEMFGVEPGRFSPTRRTVLPMIFAEDRYEWHEPDAESGMSPKRHDFRIRRPDGRVRHLSLVARTDTDPSTGQLAVFGVVQDVTLARETEARLAHVDRMAALGQLTGGIAHDVNNLLAVIALNLDLVADAVHDPQAGASLAIAQHAVDRGAALAGRLLGFAQKRPLAREAVTPSAMLRQVATLASHSLPAAVSLVVTPDEQFGPIEADATLLEAALMNLVLNARDAMRSDGGRIELAVHALALDDDTAQARGLAPGRYLAFTVTDDGIGMEPEVAARVFEPFFTTKQPGRGTGLGLSTIYGFARQSGGAIELDSALGVGTTARLLLPALPVPAEPVSDLEPDPAPVPFSGQRVLLVEDERSLRDAAVRICRDAGLDVLTAPDGDTALALLQGGSEVDLVLSDIRMPGATDGYALAEWLGAHRPEVPVVLMTGYGGDEPDPPGVLRKPFGKETLLRTLRERLARQPEQV